MELEAAEKRHHKATRSKGDAVTPVEGGDGDEKRLEEMRSKFDEVIQMWRHDKGDNDKSPNQKSPYESVLMKIAWSIISSQHES